MHITRRFGAGPFIETKWQRPSAHCRWTKQPCRSQTHQRRPISPLIGSTIPRNLLENVLKLFEEGGRAAASYLERADTQMSPFTAASEMAEASKTMGEIAQRRFSEPMKLAEAQGNLVRSYAELWNPALRPDARVRMLTRSPSLKLETTASRIQVVIKPLLTDFWKQAYLLTTNWAETVLDNTNGIDERTKQKADFYFRQVSSALSPSNFPMTNPEVVRETFQTNAKEPVAGHDALRGRHGEVGRC